MPTNSKLITTALFTGFAVAGGLAHAAQFEARDQVPSTRQIAPFAAELNRWIHMDAMRPKNLETMVGWSSLAFVGELVAVTPGRKAFRGFGCDQVQDEADGRCTGNPNAATYDSFANIIVSPVSLLRGILPVKGVHVTVEVPWPNNVDVSALKRTFPANSRVIVIGDLVRGAEEEAAPLVARGLAAPSDVARNLMRVPPYGFIIESSGGALAPMWTEGALVEGDAASAFQSFDLAVSAITTAALNPAQKVIPADVAPPWTKRSAQ